MASQAPDITSTCLVCFETRLLKIVGNCKHSFCTECLSTVFGSLESGSEVFACPSCKVDCPRPWDGIQGLVDYSESTDNAIDLVVVPQGNETEEKQQETTKTTVDVICDICVVRNVMVTKAVNTCHECNNLNICDACSKKHNKNKATRNHLLTPLVSKENAIMCKIHQKLLISFCQTCGVEACNVCVSINHEDHDIEKLADTIRSNVEVMKETLGLRENKLKEMQELQKELTLLKAMAPSVDKQDTLIKKIEDHAQKCIDRIVKWKEDLKAQIKMDYKIVRDIPECLEKVKEVVQQLEPLIKRAAQMLSETEHHPAYLYKLQAIQQDLEAIATKDDDVKGRKFRNQLLDLKSTDHRFARGVLHSTSSYGKMCNAPKSDRFEPTEIFSHKMQVDSNDMFIPCVTVLGSKYYAVAHPVKPGKLAQAIDIHEFPGTLRITLKDHVPPLYDMTSTPDGKLAVLSDGKADSTSSVKLFDSETGFFRSTRDIGIANPMSLGVTLLHEYVILGRNEEGQIEITVVDKNGAVVHIYVIDQATDQVINPDRIACGGRFIFVSGGNDENIAIYEIRATDVQRLRTSIEHDAREITDISATMWDEIYLTDCAENNLYLNMIQDKENKLEWSNFKWSNVCGNVTGVDREVRISTRDGNNIVISYGQTIKVYKLN